MIEIKVQFGDSLESILSASTTNVFSVFDPFCEQSIALRAPAVHGVSSNQFSAKTPYPGKVISTS